MPEPEPREPAPEVAPEVTGEVTGEVYRCTAAYCLIRYWVRWGADPRMDLPVVTLVSLN